MKAYLTPWRTAGAPPHCLECGKRIGRSPDTESIPGIHDRQTAREWLAENRGLDAVITDIYTMRHAGKTGVHFHDRNTYRDRFFCSLGCGYLYGTRAAGGR